MTDSDVAGQSDGGGAAVLEFKAELDAYRKRHPDCGYGALARVLARGTYGSAASVSSTTLNDATHPMKPLPTARTVRAMVLALTNGDVDAAQGWVDRRNRVGEVRETASSPSDAPQTGNELTPAAVVAAQSADEPAASAQPETAQPGPEPQRSRGRRIAAWAVAVIVVLVASNATTYWLTRPSQASSPQAHARTGDNPLYSACVRDAKVAISTRANPAFLLEVIYSTACDAAWARITRTDDEDSGNEIRVTIYRRADPNGMTRQTAVEPDAHSAFTTLIVRNDPTDRLCAVGTVTSSDRPDATGRPLCL